MAATTVENWKILQDGRVEGVILPDGDKITTSPLQNPGRAKPQSSVKTVSGSTYRLGQPSPQQQRQVQRQAQQQAQQQQQQQRQQQVQRSNNNNNNNVVLQQYLSEKTVTDKKKNNGLLTVSNVDGIVCGYFFLLSTVDVLTILFLFFPLPQ